MIARDPGAAAARNHDLVIVGGGVYGACLALEATFRGLRPLLLERGDFGGATSWNSLRILHGGLRYLQTLDLRRFRESVNERRWFCRTFPELVRPQEFLMPLYGDGLKRPGIVRTALLVNDLLSYDRNVGVETARRIARGRVLTVAETVSRFPLVKRRDLRGAGLWHDVTMLNSQRVLIELLHWACSLGAIALNYVEATDLMRQGSGIRGVQARDVIHGRTYTFASSVVCNCAGPWSPEVAAQFDRALPQLFRPSLAFNVLLDCDPPCASAVAVAERISVPPSPVYFLYPAFGRLLAGTVHVPWKGEHSDARPTEEQLHHFLAALNTAIPGLNARVEQIVRVFAGLLPVTRENTAKLSVRPIIRDHGQAGGPKGLVSVSGVKFTTARLVAEKTLATLTPYLRPRAVRSQVGRPPLATGIDFEHLDTDASGPEATDALRRIVRDEAVMTMDDLICRRTNWEIAERDLSALRRRVSEIAGWSGEAARTGELVRDTKAKPGETERASA